VSGIHDTPGTRAVSTGLQRRLGDRVSSWDDDRVQAYLADAVYLERKRFSAARGRLSEDDRAEAEAITAEDPYEKVDLFETKIVRPFVKTAGTG